MAFVKITQAESYEPLEASEILADPKKALAKLREQQALAVLEIRKP